MLTVLGIGENCFNILEVKFGTQPGTGQPISLRFMGPRQILQPQASNNERFHSILQYPPQEFFVTTKYLLTHHTILVLKRERCYARLLL
jgi:hypothetical protein